MSDLQSILEDKQTLKSDKIQAIYQVVFDYIVDQGWYITEYDSAYDIADEIVQIFKFESIDEQKIQMVANMHYFPNLLGAQVWAAVRKGNESSRGLVSALYEANVINDIQRDILLSMCE